MPLRVSMSHEEPTPTGEHASTYRSESKNLFNSIEPVYAYLAVASGSLSVFFAMGAFVTNAQLVYDFGYARGFVNLTVGDQSLHSVLWFTSLIVFWLYPFVVSKARTACRWKIHMPKLRSGLRR